MSKAITHYMEFSIERDRIEGKDRKAKTGQIMSSLITILHRIIYSAQEEGEQLCVSFPQYSEKMVFLGHVIRLHGPEEKLIDIFSPKSMAKLIKENPELMSWLIDAEYLTVSRVLPVPADVKKHAVFSRKRVKSSIELLRRRRMKRSNETYEQVCAAIPEVDRHIPVLPKVYIDSRSTKQLFPMLIECTIVDTPAVGEFSSYGLAKSTATVPLF